MTPASGLTPSTPGMSRVGRRQRLRLGARPSRTGRRPAEFDEAWIAGGGTASAISDWRLALDFIETEIGARPTGWWGLSMGTMMGLPVVASDDRIRCAVLGLMGAR